MSLPYYSTKCTCCKHDKSFAFDTIYEFENLYEDDHSPYIKIDWCINCDALVSTANPQTNESISEKIQELSIWINEEEAKKNQRTFGLFRKKTNENLIEKWRAEIIRLKEGVNFYEFREMKPKCLTCGGEDIVNTFDIHDVTTVNIDLGIQHYCGGKILVSYEGRMSFNNEMLPRVKYDLDGNILSDTRKAYAQKNTPRNENATIEIFKNVAKRAPIDSVLEQGRYSAFLIFIDEESLSLIRGNEQNKDTVSAFVEVIEDRISANDFDDLMEHDIHLAYGIPNHKRDDGKSSAKRVVASPTNTMLFQW